VFNAILFKCLIKLYAYKHNTAPTKQYGSLTMTNEICEHN